MQLSNYITNCRQRSLIKNKRGNTISVTCGTCPDCLARKSLRYTNLCKQEYNKYKYAFHITLTYDEFSIPRLKVDEYFDDNGNLILNYTEITKRPVIRKYFGKPKQVYQTFSNYNQLVYTDLVPRSYIPLYRKFSAKTNITSKYFDNDSLGFKFMRYLRQKDLVDFNKRLREHLSRESNSSYTFFAAGEYGPDTFRPHFHVLLYTDSRYILQHLERLCHKAWQFGGFTVKLVGSDSKQIDYVSHYLNSFSRLPHYLRSEYVRPFSSHSVHFGNVSNKEIRDYLYENPRKFLVESSFPTSDGDVTFVKTSTVEAVYFPRPYNYEFQTPINLQQLYTCYEKISNIFPNCSTISELTRCVIKYAHLHPSFNTFLLSLDIIPWCSTANYSDTSYPFLQMLNPLVYEELYPSTSYTEHTLDNEFTKQLFSRIYTVLNLSKHFLTFCCDKKDRYEVICLIKKYYQYKKQYELSTMYLNMQEYHNITGSLDYRLFFFNYPDYNHLYNTSNYIQSVNSFKDMEYDNLIKHKIQNDKNKIFCY